MARMNDSPRTLTEIIDEIERIREELLAIQRALEKQEPVETLVPS